MQRLGYVAEEMDQEFESLIFLGSCSDATVKARRLV